MNENKITGISSVDMFFIAKGHGAVNWNGPVSLRGDGGNTYDNHSMPKLRGFSPLSGKTKTNDDNSVYHYRKSAEEINFKETPLYISRNCLRHWLFKDHAFDPHFAKKDNLVDMLCSMTGLMRGYAVPASMQMRDSALIVEDFVDQLGNGNFEQMGRCGSKEKETNKQGVEKSNSLFSKTTFGDTLYHGYASICIEQVQFISLDKKYEKQAVEAKNTEGAIAIAQKLQAYIQSLDNTRNPTVTFHDNYVRKGTIYEQGQSGLLLNDDAIAIVVNETIRMFKDLVIRQAQSYMYVDEVTVDYNSSNKMMRIKRSPDEITEVKQGDFASYYYAKD
ncbi:type I-Fv CRISPR-associated protein Cas7fv [Photobacterium kishitanii]|uniref:Uncharacterized protein n=1 Tax=Photobacterium kishitanii TaxID=318456 RepID=A0A2T3KLX4_9GAMM|nr:type I-Fv CRISPR-associated protein Cas7fv [Photobacterium kishitanii]PSV00694.1 hypothetical protein C9J27_06015 [Photobacterium kishitanii]